MPTTAADYEKLGQFYLGKVYDLDRRTRTEALALYDSKDLVTHAVCVGMTGSGKTGLCLGLIEEAAIDGVPAIIIDPKGDLANLLLTFPNLQPADFRPWINEDDARRKGLSPDEFAAQQAQTWAKGLAEWGQSPERIARLRDSVETTIYTPASGAGIPVSVLRSFDVPPAEILEDAELLRERVASTAASLLGLVGIDGDPVSSREHVLLSAILGASWAAGEALDVPTLIQRIQTPPFVKLGVMELESVFPAKDRFAFAIALNNLVASPGFSAWTEGVPLDIQRMLFTPAGKPRHAIFSIAHLGDAERMFFVTLLLNQVVGWMRTQSGTTSLRAIVYMDEIAGYLPPQATPPSERPFLTLLKQGRAFGIGVLLASQNPIDLDYKALANAGTWFIGRLQTERDKARLLDGLEAASNQASARFDRSACERIMGQLGQRVFLMNNVHDDHPEIIESRWCLSYLRGPLTRGQIKSLMDPRRTAATSTPAAAVAGSVSAPSVPAPNARAGASAPPTRPVLPPEIPQYFIPARSTSVEYRPMLLGSGKVYYQDAKLGVDLEVPAAYLVPMGSGPVIVDFEHATETDLTDKDVDRDPAPGARFADLPAAASKAKSYDEWKKGFADLLFRSHKLALLRSESLEALSKPGESEADFRARLQLLARERRDAAAEKLRVKYAPKLATLTDRLRRAQQATAKQKEQRAAAGLGAAVSFGTALLGAFMGRKVASAGNISKAASAVRSASRTVQESGDVARAEETAEAIEKQIADIQSQFNAEVEAITSRLDPAREELVAVALKPKKANISVRAVLLAWAPYEGDTEAW